MDLHSPEASTALLTDLGAGVETKQGNACLTESRSLAKHQLGAAKITKMLCSPENNNRGVLFWFSTGSGKLASAICGMESIWDTNMRILYASSVEGIAANPPETFHKTANRFIPRWQDKTIEEVQKDFAKRGVEYFSFAQLAHLLQLHRPRKAASAEQLQEWKNKLQNTLVIIDEVHALLSPFAGQKNECDAIVELLSGQPDERTAGLKVLILTATPGDTIDDVTRILNIVRDPGSPKLTLGQGTSEDKRRFAQRIRGLVSFFDYSADYSRYPRVDEKVHRAEMSLDQAEMVRLKGGPEPAEATLDDLQKKGHAEKFWQLARRYANTLFTWPKGEPMAEFSSKLAVLLQTIAAHPDSKHFVYSAFSERRGYGGHGARAIMRALIEHGGMTEHKGTPSLRPGNRVALLSSGQPVKKIVEAFNAKENSRGNVLRVLVATQGYNEGIDLKGVRHIHVFEPLISAEDVKQLVGRGARMCSHAALKYPEEWTLTVHRYMADTPDVSTELGQLERRTKELQDFVAAASDEQESLKGVRQMPAAQDRRVILRTAIKEAKTSLKAALSEKKQLDIVAQAPQVDSEVYSLAKKRGRDVEEILQVLRDNAIDCEIFKEFHTKGGIKVTCASYTEASSSVGTSKRASASANKAVGASAGKNTRKHSKPPSPSVPSGSRRTSEAQIVDPRSGNRAARDAGERQGARQDESDARPVQRVERKDQDSRAKLERRKASSFKAAVR